MHPAEFRCPFCSTTLRLKDRSQIGRTIDCPDCQRPLQIVADSGAVRAIAAEETRRIAIPASKNPRTALRIIWAATALVGSAIIWLASRPNESPLPRADQPTFVETPVAETPPVVTETPAAAPVDPPAVAPPVADVVKEVVAATPAPAPDAQDAPLLPDHAPDVPLVNIPRQLALRIESYSQPTPAEVRLLLRQIAEFSAVPIDLTAVEVAPWKERLDQKIMFELKTTTVAGVLEQIVMLAGLSAEQKDGALHILPAAK